MSRLITQRAIVASFKQMLKDVPFNRITIAGLAERTGINRQTFYYNFRDIYDLTLFMVEDELMPVIEGEKDFSTCMLRIYDYFIEHRRMLLNISELEKVPEVARCYAVWNDLRKWTVREYPYHLPAQERGQGDRGPFHGTDDQ